MNITPLSIPDVKILEPERFGDQRGFVSETYNRRTLTKRGLQLEFVQDNHSLSRQKGTIRGLHYQVPPFAQDKLIRVIRGSILDVAVDLRQGSPTYGKHVAAVISAQAWNQILVPTGFAHGFCTLEADTEIIYKVSNYYSPEHDQGVLWNDPELGIEWPVSEETCVLSPKDRRLPRLSDIVSPFAYCGSGEGCAETDTAPPMKRCPRP
jgi:dTDP-4-dehydrorhamnose 3,5-epimerase